MGSMADLIAAVPVSSRLPPWWPDEPLPLLPKTQGAYRSIQNATPPVGLKATRMVNTVMGSQSKLDFCPLVVYSDLLSTCSSSSSLTASALNSLEML